MNLKTSKLRWQKNQTANFFHFLYCLPESKRKKPNEREHESKKNKKEGNKKKRKNRSEEETNHTAATPAKAKRGKKEKKMKKLFRRFGTHFFLFYEFIMCSFCWKMMNQSKEPSPNREDKEQYPVQTRRTKINIK